MRSEIGEYKSKVDIEIFDTFTCGDSTSNK